MTTTNTPDVLLRQTTTMMMITATSRMTTTNATTAIPAIAPVLSPVFGAPGDGEPERKKYIVITYASKSVFESLVSYVNVKCWLHSLSSAPLPKGALQSFLISHSILYNNFTLNHITCCMAKL